MIKLEQYINRKLIKASENNEMEKVKKYLELGADPYTDNASLFKCAIFNDDIILLSMLLPYKIEKLQEHKYLVDYACMRDKKNCMMELMKYFKLSDFNGSACRYTLKEYFDE